MSNCLICNEPVVLIPSAAQRAAKYDDHPASYYTALFPTHTHCQLAKNAAEVSRVMALHRADPSLYRI